jgi:hypothetical protein
MEMGKQALCSRQRIVFKIPIAAIPLTADPERDEPERGMALALWRG